MGRRLSFWLVRALLATAPSVLIAGVGCGDDDNATGGASSSGGQLDGGPDIITPPLPTYTPPPQGPPDLTDSTGRFSDGKLVGDVGQPIDGPSWHVGDSSLYFTTPGQSPSLRRLGPDGGIETVALYDGGPPGPYGTATGGSSTIFITEPNALVAMTPTPDGGAGPTLTRRPGTFQLLGDVTATTTRSDNKLVSFFVDTQTQRAYRWDPTQPVGNDLVRVIDREDAGAGSGVGGVARRATGIAVQHNDLSREVVYVALSSGASGVIARSEPNFNGTVYQDTFSDISLEGTPPNAIALDDQGNILVAWAQGIDVFAPNGKRIGSSPGVVIKSPPTSLTFGGADRKTLYVVTSTGKIYSFNSTTPGVLR